MKALRTAVIVVGAVALAATGVGALAGAGLIGSSGAFLGLSAATWGAIGAIGAAVSAVGGALTAGKPSFSGAGSPTDFTTNPQSGLPYAIGRTRMSGLKIDGKTTASPGWTSSHDLVFFAALLSIAGPVQAIESFTADNVAVTFDAGTGNAIGPDYANWMAQKVYLGAPAQATGLSLSLNGGSFPGWPRKLSGMAHAVWGVRHDSDGKHYSGGVPEPSWVGRWVKVYDPRKDSTYPGGSGSHRSNNEATWEWSRNPALHALTWAIGRTQNGKRICGIGAPIANIRVADFVEAANVADANGWGCGGVEWTTDSKWDILKRMLQACGAVPTQTGAMIGCRVKTPRVSIGTIQEADFLDGITYVATKGRRNRFNTVVPRYVSEAHNWQVVSGSEITVPAYVTADGGKRTKGIDFPLVQDEIGQAGFDGKKQAGQLAAYEIVDSREASIEFTTKPKWIGLRTGDCVTLNSPQDDIVNMKVVITSRSVDPATMTIRFTAETETDSKHAFALGQTSTPPAAPTLSVPAGRPAVPSLSDWSVDPVTMANGLPGLRVSGAIGDLIADRLLVEYRRNGTTDWQPAPDIVGQGQKALDIGPLDGVTDWDVRLAYRAGNQIGDWLEITPVGTGTNDLRDELEAQIASIASDDVLSRGEKPHVQREYDALYENWIALDAKASSLGIASAQRTAANAAMSVLYTYLSSLSPSWADTGNDTPIVGATFNAKWADAYAAVAALQAAIQGQPGADGTTFYDWHAYADSADGTVNFTTGAPLGRTWQGVRHGNTSPTESTNPADYTWTPYAGPSSVGFAGSSGTQVSGNKIVRTAAYTGGWDQQVYSTEGFYQGAQVKFQAIENGAGYGAIGSEGMGGFFIGLNTDPLTDSGFGSIDHGIQCDHTNSGTGNLNIIEGGTGFIIGVSTYVESDVFSIVYDNDRVRYYKNATLLRDVYVGPDKTFYMDSSLGHPGTRGKVLNFGPAAKKGADGDDGYTVTPNGKSYSISANAAGIIRSGELPKSETFRVLKGLTDVSTDAATGYSISAWANVSVSLASNVLTIDDLSAETGFVEVAITRSGVPIAVARFDLGKAKDGTNASFAQTLIINPGNTGSYGSTGSDPLTIPVGPNGTVSLAARVSYSVPSLNSVQAAKWQYRATPGSGGWTDVAAETVDPVGATAGNPSTFNVTATIAGPAAGANWEFQLVTRRASGSSSSAAASGSNRASASWAP